MIIVLCRLVWIMFLVINLFFVILYSVIFSIAFISIVIMMIYILSFFWIGLLVFLGNQSMFFFNEEFIIALALVLFITIVCRMLSKLFLKTFFMEIRSIYICFNFLFNLNIKLITIVSNFVDFLIIKNRSFLAEFLYMSIFSYMSYLCNQKNFLLNLIDNLSMKILRSFYLHSLNLYRYCLNRKDLYLFNTITALYYRLNIAKKAQSYLNFIC